MTYPNVLLMGYLRETRQLTPERQMKLEQALSQGYQRLLTFEVKGGGFDWYGRAPANTILTAYGVLEFNDMAKVFSVDRAVIDRAIRLLRSRQQSDGSWGDLATTAYVAWALREAGAPNDRATRFLEPRVASVRDAYILALVANALSKEDVIARLESLSLDGRWPTQERGLFHAWGEAATIEASALATLVTGSEKGLAFLARSKDPYGSWQTTQATILALKALLQAGKARPPQHPVALKLRVNGREIENAFQPVSAANFDVAQAIDITPHIDTGENTVEIDGELTASVQVAGRFVLPWDRVPRADSPFELDVRYDRTDLTRNEPLEARVRMTYRGEGTFMVIVDVGIPPGFDVDRAPFERLVEERVIDKYTIAGRQVTLYFGAVSKGATTEFRYTVRPRFPVFAATPTSSCYEYYAPDQRADAKPPRVRVAE